MNPAEFAHKWQELAPKLSERAAYQEHWRDLCALLGEPTPTSDLTGDDYAFEKHVKKAGTGETGYADVFRRGHFVAEYKAKGKSLGKALQQALLYARELGNPPLLLVSDLSLIEIHTNFTGSSPRAIRITLDDIERDAPVGGDLSALAALRACFRDPARLDPRQLRERVTRDATARIGEVAQALAARGVAQTGAAHFLMRVVFAMFAEDVGLLERGLLTRLLRRAREYPERSQGYFQELFSAMQGGGEFWGTDIRHFNGGLFDDSAALGITQEDADALLAAATLDWAEVEPAIFGTLFENSLDATTRSRRGAHYTGVPDILRVVEPVVMVPLRREWADVKAQADALSSKRGGKAAALEVVRAFQDRLAQVSVLDPACGSGNFLVVTLGQLLDLEHEVRSLAFELGAGPFAVPPKVHPRQLLGIEIEPFAHELASVSVWIAFFQWKAAHGGEWETPVLQALTTIQNRDALLNPDGTETQWPAAEFIVGNPPFLGNKRMRSRLGDAYVDQLQKVFGERVSASADFVAFWPEKARAAIEAGPTRRAGFVTTQAIRTGGSREVLERVLETGSIFMAYQNQPWHDEGAAVRVSLFAFDDGSELSRTLDGQPVAGINASLSAQVDVRSAQPLSENAGVAFQGPVKVGAFDIPGDLARVWLAAPNPGGVSNADVLKPWVNGMDITRRPSDTWIIDFDLMTEEEARRYLLPFAYVEQHVKPERLKNKDKQRSTFWWRLGRSGSDLKRASAGKARILVTPRVAKHRLWTWMPSGTLPDSRVLAVTRDDDFTFGVLQSRIHEAWSLAASAAHGVGNDPTYVARDCFDPFPFPRPTAGQRASIEEAARFVVTARDALLGQDPKATLTGLYNALATLRETVDSTHPAMTLLLAHNRLDAAVAAAYGWEWPLTDDEVLARLLALNLERAARGRGLAVEEE
ncbi:Type II restriction/modification system, DNA methylase subunit YeeA [Deinococcus reticulitermitis]|uniref:site-specific DNA-methyltransferase (adenine-specific) n=1 Tax=Deinococcus reticulitermitis TaxID=856736 RepID=A0A1H6SFZ1_9DEIO|nr:class I SAM-dependent DNA methyltransferase [Deinococcus reticulitermitis]SEI65776.1 Type II restriction/modification system, DNA methylase subunit YeeA [Deinococcus reticulitermitis]